jgi:diamine N-acetyltransferase
MEWLPIIIYRFNSYLEPMHAVEYRTCGIHEINLIRPLWEQLNDHHHSRASRFRTHYEQMSFEDRTLHFRKLHESGQLQVDLAYDPETCRYIGYCVSSVSAENNGEIESIFVDPSYRSAGIGTALMARGLAWMDALEVVQKRVSVGAGNEPAFAFYRKFGFFPRMTILEQKGD